MAEQEPGAGAERAIAAAIAHGLAEAGTRTLFGLPGGGSNLDLIGECELAGLEFVLARGETAAAIMAAAHGELTGVPGACVVTRGPGAASAVNGVAHALLDRAPMLIVTDCVRAGDTVRVSHQRLDQLALLRPVSKWSVSVGAENAAEVVESAIRVAGEPPAGPVHLDVDPDAAAATVDLSPPPRSTPSGEGLARARDLVGRSRSPILALGVGARRAPEAVRRACARLGAPILTTYKAKGIVPESSPTVAGLLTGATIEADLLRRADLIVGVGLDPVELIPAPWPYEAPILALSEWGVDSDYFAPTVEIIGPLEQSLELLAPLAEASRAPEPVLEGPLGLLQRALDVPAEGLRPQDVVRAARELLPPGTIATIDSGAHMFPATAFWTVEEPDEVVISSGLATMGFALPAAVAAACARPGRRVVCMIGDGGLGIALAELETLARYSLPVLVVVLNDAALSLIAIKQRAGQGGPGAVSHTDVDFAAVARGLGLGARRVTSLDELRPALDAAAAAAGPFLIDAVVDPGGYRAVLSAVRGGTR